MEKCAQAVLDLLAVTDVRKFLPKQTEKPRKCESGQQVHGQEAYRQEVPGQN